MTTATQKACGTYLDLPENWTRRRLRFDVRLNPSKSELHMAPTELVSFVPMEAIKEYGGLNLDAVRELGEVYVGYTYFADGDICIAKITPCFENGKGALAEALTNGVGFGTTELHVIRPGLNVDRRFLFYVTIADDFRKLGESEMYGAGGQKRIDENFVNNWVPPLPPIDAQRRIARFLDEKTARIDGLIEKKRKLLERLAEERQAVITRAVTRGVDSARLDRSNRGGQYRERENRQTGLGGTTEFALPSGWSFKRLKYLATYNDEVLAESTDEEFEIDYVRIAGVDLVRGIHDIERTTFGQAPSRARRKVKAGDVLIATVGSYLRAIVKIDRESSGLIVSTGFCVVRPSNDLDNGFFGWTAKSDPFLSKVDARSVGVIYPAILAGDLVDIRMHLPPLDTQREIARFLYKKVAQIDAVRVQILRSIDHLWEYRSALITAAVTGQIAELR